MNSNRWLTLVFFWGWLALDCFAVVYNLAAPSGIVGEGAEIRLELVVLNPATVATELNLPVVLDGKLSADTSRHWPVELRIVGPDRVWVGRGGFSVHEYAVTLPTGAHGRLVLKIAQPVAAKVALEVREGVSVTTPVQAPPHNLLSPQTAETVIHRTFARRFSAHEAIYFIYGDEEQAAKFQFSFRYRIFGAGYEPDETTDAVRRLLFGFTQRSLWDIEASSSPFYDTSYMPELIFESQALVDPGSAGGFKWLGYQVGVKHESNGRTGSGSRSVNTVYFRPGLALGRLDGWNLIIVPRFQIYVSDLSDNDNILNYRGNVELLAAFGRNDGWAMTVVGRLGRSAGKGSIQADLTIPLKFERALNFATYFMIQYWDGYGESLLDYNAKSTAVRAGFSLVR